ncbi:hypothetical protein HY546_02830, partial [archaeon]|nr:hypothetical protein [archaeon]
APNMPTLQIKWRDRDGLLNYLSPAEPLKVNFTFHPGASLSPNTGVVLSPNVGAVYTVVNDKVLYLSSITPVASNNYSINFYVGGNPSLNPEAFQVSVGPIGVGSNAVLSVGGNSGFTCTFKLLSSINVEIYQWDPPPCDLFPDRVEFGPASTINRTQWMDLLFMGHGAREDLSDGNWSRGGIVYTGSPGSPGGPIFFPYVRVYENTSVTQTGVLGPRNYTVLYDANSSANWYGAPETTPRYGFVVVDTILKQGSNGQILYYSSNLSLLNLSQNSSGSPLVEQDVATSAFSESRKYHVDAFGTEFNASATGQLKITHPGDQLKAVLRITNPASQYTYDITYLGQANSLPHSLQSLNRFATRGPSTGTNVQILAPALGGALSTGSVSAKYGTSQASSPYVNWTFREELNLTNTNVSYDENDFPPVVGHGLYWNATDGAIRYSIVFDTGLATGYNSNSKFQTVPKIRFLGREFGIDTAVMNSTGFLDLYPGIAWNASAGSNFTSIPGYIVEFIGTSVSSSNTTIANIRVTRLSDGYIEQRTDLQNGVGWPFFASPTSGIGEITVYIENATVSPSTLSALLGKGQVRVRAGQEFTPDRRWYVPSTGGLDPGTDGSIKFFSFVYGNRSAPSSAPEERGNFQGTALNGLKTGYVLNGPLQADGTPKFTIRLLGFS